MPQTKQEMELYLFLGYRLKFKKSVFFPDRRIRSNMVTSLLFLLFFNLLEIQTFVFKATYRTCSSCNCFQLYRF